MKVTSNKKEFLKSEHKELFWYWQDYSYAEYLREMKPDAVKCKCGIYYWKHCKKPCKCP